jgi:hypothetical protein
MKISEITQPIEKIDEFVDTDPKLKDEDVQKILAVKDNDFGPAMTSEDLLARMKKLIGSN